MQDWSHENKRRRDALRKKRGLPLDAPLSSGRERLARSADAHIKTRARLNVVVRERVRERVRVSPPSSYYRLKRYGITEEQYQQMLADQGNACAICETPFTEGVKVCVDHCHDKKHVRGILCDPCNRGLGAFRDDPDRLQNAINYLDGPA